MVNLKMQHCSPVLYLQIFITKNYSLFKIAASLFLKLFSQISLLIFLQNVSLYRETSSVITILKKGSCASRLHFLTLSDKRFQLYE